MGKAGLLIISLLNDCGEASNIKSPSASDGLELDGNLRSYLWRLNEEDPKEALGYLKANEYCYGKVA